MDTNIKIGFWNYVPTGAIENKQAVADWETMGFNLPLSWDYDEEKHDKKQFLSMLDECANRKMKVIVNDKRTLWTELTKKGEEEYIRGVENAIKDFGSHPAVFGFHIGDEPAKAQMPDVIKAYRIVKEKAPHLSPFVNHLPYWEDFADKKAYDEHVAFLDSVVKQSKSEMICYDYYGQMGVNDGERLVDLYFKNLNLFGEVARKNHIPLWTTLLSTAHYNSKKLTEEDIVWQLNTAIAHGCTGLLWFYVYFGGLVNGSYRDYAIYNYEEKCEYNDMFKYLSRSNRAILRYVAPVLNTCEFDCVRHINKSFGYTPLFVKEEFEIKNIEIIVNFNAPLIVTRFINRQNKKPVYFVVNNDREKPVKINIEYKEGAVTDTHGRLQAPDGWLAPGQATVIEL